MLMKLLLNTKDFDGKIGKSKKEVTSLGDVGKAALGDFAGFLGKVTAAAGIAVGGMELFNKAMGSSQSLSDAFGRNIEFMKVGLDNFVYSLANADFSAFNNGLSEMARKAREMYDAYDQLANTVMSTNFATTLDQARYRQLMVKARDKNLSLEERQAALDEAKALGASIAASARKTEQDSMKALASMFAAKTGADASLFTPQMIEEAFRIDSRFDSDEQRKRILMQYKQYEKEMENVGTFGKDVLHAIFSSGTNKKTEYEKEKMGESAAIQEKYKKVLIEYIALMRLSDDELQNSMNTYISAVNAVNASAEIATSTNEVQTTMDNEAKTAADRAEKAAAEARINAEMRQVVYDAEGADGKIAAIGMPDVGKLPEKVQSLDIPNVWDSVIIKDAEKRAEEFETMSTSVDMLSSSFSQLGGAIGGTAGNMLTFIGSITDAVGAIIPFISYLYAESAAHKTNASEAAREAAAKSLSAHAGIPFVGIGLGLAAVSAIITAIQSIPKFAEGGIVTSATLGVFGEAGPEAVMPLSKLNDYIAPREIRISGEFRAKGKDLVATVGNYEQVRKVK